MPSTIVLVRGRSWALTWQNTAQWHHMKEPPDPAPRWGFRRYHWQPDQIAYGVYCYPLALRWVRPVSCPS